MSISIRAKQDYSTLFAGLNSGSGSSSSNMLGINLSDYACIKSGSYGKLMKAYYAKNRTEEVDQVVNKKTDTKSNLSVSDDTTSTIAKLEKSAAGLSAASEKLAVTDEKESLFTEKEITTKNEDGTETRSKGYDRDAIYEAVSSFASQYNSLIGAAQISGNSRVNAAYTGLTNLTDNKVKSLEEIGITVGSDKKLSVDKDTLNAADVDKIKSVFQSGYATGVQNRADLIEMYAENDAAKASGLYGATGTYTSQLASGNLYNSFF